MKSWTFADVAAHWDSVSYDESNAGIDSHLRRFTDSAPLFTIPEHAKILDIDCRTANGTIFFKKKYPTASFTCVAMAESFKRIAEEKLQKNNIHAHLLQLRDLPLHLSPASFDTVLCYETIEHVPNPGQFLTELARVLKRGGTLVLTTPNVLWEPVHWLSATFKWDHGEGPHRMLPRDELLFHLRTHDFVVQTERSFVLIPAGPKWLLRLGKGLESIFPEWLLRTIALRRTLICKRS